MGIAACAGQKTRREGWSGGRERGAGTEGGVAAALPLLETKKSLTSVVAVA